MSNKKMKFKMKKVFLALSLVAVLGLTSCGGSQTQEATTEVEAVEIDSATISDTTDPEGLEVEGVEEPTVE
jgi:ABC-type glycerol-3-phosphate transport system substrate-binding protein